MEIRRETKKKEEKPAGASPLILAMKGHPGAGKSTIARALASSLRCPLLDKDDIRDSTIAIQRHPLFTSSSASAAVAVLLNDLSYEALWRLASTQLRLGLSIVVDSPLSRPAHLDRLRHIAAAEGARLLVIECRPKDEEEWRRRIERRGAADDASWHKPCSWKDLQRLLEGYGGCTEYDVGDVPKLVLDTTATAEVGEIASSVLEFVETHRDRTALKLRRRRRLQTQRLKFLGTEIQGFN
ncbi:hypothetical protein Nepgr_019082 [Nepenthes gracilis]|uniref:Uncharacterized protein n=1 Tax=Nepenthes gracilis TaxID=150966 RepID=A0AAD3SWB6_NEPGR|nr:hypothetical protein Nepgr_019082 [Nepenthes gracilis]